MAEPTEAPDPLGRATTIAGEPVTLPAVATSRVRLFGSGSFFRLWLAQVVSSLGDWIGLVAILALAARVGGRGGNSGASIGLVMSARMIPGFFLAPVGGVLVDRWNRKRVMVLCDAGRGLVVASLPFVDTIWGLFFASLLIEIMTLLWTPSKEASVPNLVPAERLTTANSLSLVAAYGTFPVAAGLSALLFKLAETLSHYSALDVLRVNRESVALYFDVLTFLVSAVIISTLVLPKQERHADGEVDLGKTFTELKDGWRLIGTHPVVRSVMVGIGAGLIGGAMVVPLGVDFSIQVLHGGPAGFSLLLTGLGLGTALGVLVLSALQKRLPRERIFTSALLAGGVCMFAGASAGTLTYAFLAVAGLGVCGGAAYVTGFTILHENVEDEFRGRIFATLYTLIRLATLVALAVAPFLSGLLDKVSRSAFGHDRAIRLGSTHFGLPGVRLTLYFGSAILVGAGMLAAKALRGRRPALVAE